MVCSSASSIVVAGLREFNIRIDLNYFSFPMADLHVGQLSRENTRSE